MKARASNLSGVWFAVSISFLAWLPAPAADWPQWHGPNRDGVSTETGMLRQWPAEGPRHVWLFDRAGKGYSGCSVAGGKLFTMGTRDGKEILIALDAAIGRELWATPVDDIFENSGGDGPRSTPTVNDGRVYALSGKGNIVCAEVSGGKVLWSKSIEGLGGKMPEFGCAESPLVDGKLVIVTPGGDKGTLAALDKMTGAPVWRSDGITEGAQYSSIVPAVIGGKRQYVQFLMQNVFGVDAATGKVAWRSPWAGKSRTVVTPIVMENEVFISGSASDAGSRKVKVNGGAAKDVFVNKDVEFDNGGVVRFGDCLYGHSGSGWTCMSFADGSVKWAENEALGDGSIICADGMLYCVEEKGGNVVLAEAAPAGWTEKGRFKIEPRATGDGSERNVLTHPVIANGKLYLRDQNYIYCYDVKKTGP